MINEVMTNTEVRQLWDVSRDRMENIMHKDGRVAFIPGTEIRYAKGAGESKGRWLLSRAGAERVFGMQKHGERDGDPKEVDLYAVLTRKEAAALWGLSFMQVRWAEERHFKPGEFRKSGQVTLITKSAMERVFGEQKAEQINQEIVTAEMLAGATVDAGETERRLRTLFNSQQSSGVTWLGVMALLTPFARDFSRRRNKHEAKPEVIEEAAKLITQIFEQSADFEAVMERLKYGMA